MLAAERSFGANAAVALHDVFDPYNNTEKQWTD
jgi:hypothetical protein